MCNSARRVTERLLAVLRAGDRDAAILALLAGSLGLVEAPLFEYRFLLAGSAEFTWAKR